MPELDKWVISRAEPPEGPSFPGSAYLGPRGSRTLAGARDPLRHRVVCLARYVSLPFTSMSSRVQRTYGSHPPRTASEKPPSSPQLSGLSSSPPPPDTEIDNDGHAFTSLKRKRPLIDDTACNAPQLKKSAFLIQPKLSVTTLGKGRTKLGAKRKGTKDRDDPKMKQKQLTQLHFALETSVLRTCATCALTYTRGAPDDESLHRAHCARVQKGMEWGKEEEREAKNGKVSVEEVRSDVKLRNGAKGRVVCFRADVGGKIGSKVCGVTGILVSF